MAIKVRLFNKKKLNEADTNAIAAKITNLKNQQINIAKQFDKQIQTIQANKQKALDKIQMQINELGGDVIANQTTPQQNNNVNNQQPPQNPNTGVTANQ